MSSSSLNSQGSTPAPPPPDPPSQPTSSYLSYPVSHVVSALYRRLTEPSAHPPPAQATSQQQNSPTPPRSMPSGVYTPPHRTASPFQPPPLTPLSLVGFDPATSPSAQILSRALAEEIRLLVPPRLQLADTWSLVYSLEQDGVSLATLYKKCASSDLPKSSSFVLVIRDAAGGVRFNFFSPICSSSPLPCCQDFLWPLFKLQSSTSIPRTKTCTHQTIKPSTSTPTPLLTFLIPKRLINSQIFGAYLTDPPRPSPSFYGTGECFIWRASLLPSTSLLSISLPPPPSAPTTASLPRSTTIASPTSPSASSQPSPNHSHNHADPTQQQRHSQYENQNHNDRLSPFSSSLPPSSTSTQATTALLRFKAFPYSGINDYLIFCQPAFLSVGGGDGRYGLWLDAVLERGVSSPCLTFGNEGLSEEGPKFEVVGVEVWCLGR